MANALCNVRKHQLPHWRTGRILRYADVQRTRGGNQRFCSGRTAGEDVVIARAGVAVVRLMSVAPMRRPRVLCRFAGLPFALADDFGTLPADIAEAFGAVRP